MAGHEGGERDVGGAQTEGGAECQVVDEDGVRRGAADDVRGGASHELRFPQEIRVAPVGLVAQGRDHPESGGVEERAEVVVGRSLAGDPGVAAATHAQLLPVEPCGGHVLASRSARGDRHVAAVGPPRCSDCGQRQVVGEVVRADDEEPHAEVGPGARATSA